MKAVVLRDGQLRYEADYQPHPEFISRPNFVEVKILQAGICETDLQLVQGYMGFSGVLGHEFVGIAKSGPLKGKRVAGEINCACKKCSYCARGMQNHCPQRTVVGILNHDGAFAESLWLPAENLHLIPDNVSNDEAVFVEPLAAAFQILTQVDTNKFEKIVVLGDGRLGNLCAQVIHSQNQSLMVVGKHEAKLSLLRKLGIETVRLDALDEIPFANLVVDCTGSRTGIDTAMKIIRPKGTLILKSTFAGGNGPNLAPLVIHEIQLIGSRCGPFDTAIQALSNRTISVQNLITSRYPIKKSSEAFAAAKQKDQLKVILEITTSLSRS